jgi:hypothetical protein
VLFHGCSNLTSQALAGLKPGSLTKKRGRSVAENEMEPEIEREPDAERRNFLQSCGKLAVLTPPAVTFFLSTSMSSKAIAASGGTGGGGGGGIVGAVATVGAGGAMIGRRPLRGNNCPTLSQLCRHQFHR